MKPYLGAVVISMPLVLGACGTYPIHIPEPARTEGKIPASADNAIPFAKVQDLSDASHEFAAYYRLYEQEAYRKRRNEFGANETGFLMGVIGALGGIGKSVETAAAGALGAAGAGLYSDRYRLTVQAQNYELAAAAMRCMYFLTQDIANSEYGSVKFVGDERTFSERSLSAARQNFWLVYDKLRRLQTTFALGQPDLSKLSQKPVANTLTTVDKTKVLEQDKPKLENFEADMARCSAAMTG